jgi:hypothetical protein
VVAGALQGQAPGMSQAAGGHLCLFRLRRYISRS